MNNNKDICECEDPKCKEHDYADCSCCIDAEFRELMIKEEDKNNRRNK